MNAARKDVTSKEADEIHKAAQKADDKHDQIDTWTMCVDCHFDAIAILTSDKAAGNKWVF